MDFFSNICEQFFAVAAVDEFIFNYNQYTWGVFCCWRDTLDDTTSDLLAPQIVLQVNPKMIKYDKRKFSACKIFPTFTKK